MYTNSVSASVRRISALHTWLRLLLAAFILAVCTVGALGGGVAAADDGPGSGSDPGADGAKTSQQSESGAAAKGSAPGSTPGTGATATDPPTAKVAESGAKDDETSPSVRPSVRPSVKPDPPEKTVSDPLDSDTTLPDGEEGEEPEDQTSSAPETAGEDVSIPVVRPVVEAPHASKRSAPPAIAAVPTVAHTARPAVAQPSAVAIAPGVRGVDPAVATLAEVAPAPPVVAIAPRLDLQLQGVVVDAATITVSAVHSVATAIAHAFGPSSFLGVPYMLATAVANAAAAVGRTIVGAPFPSAGDRFPVTYGILDVLALLRPTTPPAGANDPSITVTPEHPLPVLLLNGTGATQGANWSVVAPVLANAGYKVYTFNYGNVNGNPNFPLQSIADIRQSAAELDVEVDRILAETGAPQVILIGHSQGGGNLPGYYVNNLAGGAAKVSQVIGIAPGNHGGDLYGFLPLQYIPILGPLAAGIVNAIAPALFQQQQGSPFQQEIYGNGDTRPEVLYTTIISITDEVVTPYTNQLLNGGDNVTNVVLQDRYPGLVLGHANIITSPQAMAAMLEALAKNPAANPLAFPRTVAA